MKRVLLAACVLALAGAAPAAAIQSAPVSYSTPAWSPDGKSIAFVGDGAGDLFVMNTDGSGIRQLTNSYSFGSTGPSGRCNTYLARFPTWSPDSRTIAFAYGSGGICLINADGSGFQRISDTGDEPRWSPGGKKIAFVEGETSYTIYVMGTDGGGKQLVARPGDYHSFDPPAWSPDGQLLAFGVTWAGDSEVVPGYLGVISRYRGRVRAYLRGYNPFAYSWHGTKIAVQYDRIANDWGYDSHVRIGVFDMRTKTLKPLHVGKFPSWAPDGRSLAFEYRRSIWVITANGTGAHRLTHN